MISFKKILIPVLLFSAFSCKNMQEQTLDDSSQIALEEPPEIGIPANTYHNGMLFDFKGPINKFWVANDKLSIAKVGDTLKVDLRECGQKYECWGTELNDLLDFSKSPVLKVTARSVGKGMTPTLGISLKDMDGYDTNLDRPSQRVRKSNDYVDYYFDFTGKWKQIWPDKKVVNSSAISEILFFVNPGAMNWTGTIYIDDIQVITLDEMPSKEELRQRRLDARAKAKAKAEGKKQADSNGQDTSKPETESSVEEAQKDKKVNGNLSEQPSSLPIQEDAKAVSISSKGDLSNWWSSDKDKIKFSTENEKMLFTLDGVGPAFETFGKTFPAVDFTKTPVLKVHLKVEGEPVGKLRVDIKDMEGFSTNSNPNVKVFNSGTEFVDLYYDFSGKFLQSYPNIQKVRANEIVGVVLYVNPGGTPFKGKLYIDEITAISLNDFNKIKK